MPEHEPSLFEKIKNALPDWMKRLFGIEKKKVEVKTKAKTDIEKLRQSIESITRQGHTGAITRLIEMADAQGSGYDTRNYDLIRQGINRKTLALPEVKGVGYKLDIDAGGIGESEGNEGKKRLLRALTQEAYRTLQALGQSFYKRFGKSFEVTSTARTDEYYKKMKGAKSITRQSSHKNGLAFDIAYKRLSQAQQDWLWIEVAELQKQGKISVAKEGIGALHIFSIPYSSVRRSRAGTSKFLNQKNTTVEALQEKLRDRGYYTGEIDGVIGRGTFTAIRNFQRDNFSGRTADPYDGIVGEKTHEKLFG